MDHADDADLALIASGVPVDERISDHVDGCDECRRRADEWRSLMSDGLTKPSPATWEAIHRTLQLAPSLVDDPLVSPRPAAVPVSEPLRRTTSRPQRRGSLFWVTAAAAAVVIAVLGGLAGAAISGRDAAPKQTLVAEARLEPFPGWTDAGQARIEENASGARTLIVSVPDSAPEGDLKEVWLMKNDLSGLVSVGLLSGRTGSFDVPSDIDLAEYSVVDISAEPQDGNPAHSGNSIVRGTLKTR